MTAALGLEAGRRPAPGAEEVRRQLLALVLALVLVWYTLVVPAGAAGPRRPSPDDEGDGGEVRGVKSRTPARDSRPAKDLDWPEYIYP